MVEDEVLRDRETEVGVGDTALDDRRVCVDVKRPDGQDQQADDERRQPINSLLHAPEQRHIDHWSATDQNINKPDQRGAAQPMPAAAAAQRVVDQLRAAAARY